MMVSWKFLIRRSVGCRKSINGYVALTNRLNGRWSRTFCSSGDSPSLHSGGVASEICAVSPIDGRYARHTKELRNYFSEFALLKARMRVEVSWLQKLSKVAELPEVPPLCDEHAQFLDEIWRGLDLKGAEEVKNIEKITNHDVKAIEYYIKEKCANGPSEVKKLSEFVHFCCTSEDINNLAYALLLRDARDKLVLPTMDKIIAELVNRADEYKDCAMISRTHGQPATPSTMGKELANFAYRLAKQRHQVSGVEILGKMNGAVGNFAAHQAACPDVNWGQVSKEFLQDSLGLVHNPYTTQIEPHDYIAELSHSMIRFNNVLLDASRDMWGYVSLGYFKQSVVTGEVGSSTMPHKVNPIDFENCEGNIGLGNATFSHLAQKLPVSRFQRDLSDSTVMRSLGNGFAYSMIAHTSFLKGFSRVAVNAEKLNADLEENWEVLAEPIQTVMRRVGNASPYEKLKELTRGKRVTSKLLHEYIDSLDIPRPEKDRLIELSPSKYTGNSKEMSSRDVLTRNLKQLIDISLSK